MSARGPLCLALAALFALSAQAPAAAQSPPPPPPAEEAEVADVLHERTSSSLLEIRFEDAPSPLREERKYSLTARFRRAKTPAGWTLRFSAWERREGEKRDLSLAGAEVRFAEDPKQAALPTWSLAPEPAVEGKEPQARELSEAAKRYLTDCARELQAPLAGPLLGADPGATRWKPDLAPLAARLLPSARVDLERSRGKGSREADPGRERARGDVSLELQATRIPGTGAWLVKGGLWSGQIELGWPGARTPVPETTSWRLKASFEGEARDQRPDGAAVKLRVKAEESERWVVTPQE